MNSFNNFSNINEANINSLNEAMNTVNASRDGIQGKDRKNHKYLIISKVNEKYLIEVTNNKKRASSLVDIANAVTEIMKRHESPLQEISSKKFELDKNFLKLQKNYLKTIHWYNVFRVLKKRFAGYKKSTINAFKAINVFKTHREIFNLQNKDHLNAKHFAQVLSSHIFKNRENQKLATKLLTTELDIIVQNYTKERGLSKEQYISQQQEKIKSLLDRTFSLQNKEKSISLQNKEKSIPSKIAEFIDHDSFSVSLQKYLRDNLDPDDVDDFEEEIR